jgi:hypothetical protein
MTAAPFLPGVFSRADKQLGILTLRSVYSFRRGGCLCNLSMGLVLFNFRLAAAQFLPTTSDRLKEMMGLMAGVVFRGS